MGADPFAQQVEDVDFTLLGSEGVPVAVAPFLDALLTVYHDARIVVTHRDPIKPLGSSCSASFHITNQLNTGFDRAEVGQQTMKIIADSLEGVCRLADDHPRVPVYDFHYRRFAADPLAEIHRLYDFLPTSS